MKILSTSLKLVALIFLSVFAFNTELLAQKKATMAISTNHADAQILVNGRSAGNGSAKVTLLPNVCTKISAKKEGLFVKEVEFCNTGLTKLPKAHYLELEKDAAFEASVQTDIANVDLNIRPKKSQDDSWKEINSLVLQYIDAIETSDKSNFYLRTAWVAQNFNSGIVRTRLIIKSAGNDQFSVKIISEFAPPGSSVKDDEKFTAWDRVLRKYAPVIEELQSRL
jgi:hypothetical protein